MKIKTLPILALIAALRVSPACAQWALDFAAPEPSPVAQRGFSDFTESEAAPAATETASAPQVLREADEAQVRPRLQLTTHLSQIAESDGNGRLQIARSRPEDHRQLYHAMTQKPLPVPEPEEVVYEAPRQFAAVELPTQVITSKAMAQVRQNVDRHPATSRRAGGGAVRLAGADLHRQMLGRSIRGVRAPMNLVNGRSVALSRAGARPKALVRSSQAPVALAALALQAQPVEPAAARGIEGQLAGPLGIETHYRNSRMQREGGFLGKELPVYEVGDQMRFQHKITNNSGQTLHNLKVTSQDEKVLRFGRAGKKLANRDEAWTIARLAPGQSVILEGAHDAVSDHMETGLQQMHVTVNQGGRTIQDTPDAAYIDP